MVDGDVRSIDELWAALEQAEAAVAAFGPSPEQLRQEAAEAERMANETGTPAKSAKVIHTLARRWSEFLGVHGEAYEYDEGTGPTIELAVHFQVCLQRFRAWGGRIHTSREQLGLPLADVRFECSRCRRADCLVYPGACRADPRI